MVRINIIHPRYLTDQHLIAEYNEILMLLAYVRRYPKKDCMGVERFTLGKGHMKFFKDKLLYIKRRHDAIREEMSARGYRASKLVDISMYPRELLNDWSPSDEDLSIIKQRIIEKISKKRSYYTYHRKVIDELYMDMLIHAKAL
jgi:deoxyribonuclease (pyrimidine dimer)